MLDIKELSVTYGKGENAVHALRNISLHVEKGEFISVVGKSGCGKSTLLKVLGGITKATEGEYYFQKKLVSKASGEQLTEFRKNKIGFVVQQFALIQDMSIYQNIALPLKYKGYKRRQIKQRVEELLLKFGLSEKEFMYPSELSGGQCQRAAIARAIVGEPKLLLADEPTGALDEETGQTVMDIFRELNKKGITIIMVTHDKEIAKEGNRIIEMKDGEIVSYD